MRIPFENFQYILENATHGILWEMNQKWEHCEEANSNITWENIKVLVRMCVNSNAIPYSKYLHWNVHKKLFLLKLKRKRMGCKKKEKKDTYDFSYIYITFVFNIDIWLLLNFIVFLLGGFEYCSYCTEKLQKCVD